MTNRDRIFAEFQKLVSFDSESGHEEEIGACLQRRLRDLGADCLCLDCMGYTAEQGRQLRSLTGLPVKVPREEIAARINSLIPHP